MYNSQNHSPALGQLECHLEKDLGEDLSFLLEETVTSVSWYEKEPENWAFQVIFELPLETFLREKIKAFFNERALPLPEITSSLLSKEDWVISVYRDFPPLTIGQFYIYGSHIHADPPQNFIPLRIDAATAFGSGQHGSTEGCLKVLNWLAERKSFKFPLDMGCGSGILAFAMARLWKVPVLACDNDPEAMRVTQENARTNSLDSLIKTQLSDGFSALKNRSFDIITANILADPLCQMARDAFLSLMPGGNIILAGLLDDQAERVINTYENEGAKLITQLSIGGWSTLLIQKESCGYEGHE